MNASYASGEDRLDAKWQYLSLEEVESAFRPGVTARITDNIAESLMAVKLAAIEAKLVVENILTSMGEPLTQIIFSHDALLKVSQPESQTGELDLTYTEWDDYFI